MAPPPSRAAANLRVRQRAARRRRFIATAQALFLRHGYAGTSVNAVVRKAGGSLATLYAEFGTKQGLFEAVMRERAGAAFGDAGTADAGDIATRLTRLAARVHDRTLSADSLGLYRLAIAEGPRLASLRHAVLDAGLEMFISRLGQLFAHWRDAGDLAVDDVGVAARHFLALVQGQHQFIAGCGGARRISADARRRHLDAAVQAFLRLYRT